MKVNIDIGRIRLVVDGLLLWKS